MYSSRAMVKQAIYLGLMLLMGGIACADPLGSIVAVRDLPVADADKGQPVLLEGQVAQAHPTGSGFFLHDGGMGIYIKLPGMTTTEAGIAFGQMVRIHGRTSAGDFSPSILADKLEVLGSKPLPEARPFRQYEMYSAAIDCDWVSVSGRLVSIRSFNRGRKQKIIMLGVEYNDVILDVNLPWSKNAENKLSELIFQRIRCNAVAGTVFNSSRQIVGRIFYVNSADDFKVIDDFEPSGGVKPRPIHELMRQGAKSRLPAATVGWVTHVGDREIFLRGEESCLRAVMPSVSGVQVGDYVELHGFVWPRPISPAFFAHSVNVLEKRSPPEPVKLELNEELKTAWKDKLDSSLNQELVQIDVQLVDVGKSFGLLPDQSESRDERTLLCRHGSYLFEARLPSEMELSDDLAPGATLRLTGICNLIQNQEMRWRLYIDWFWIQLYDADDIVVLTPAPWWTTARLLWLLGIGLGVLTLFLVWIQALRKTVDRQTGIIGKQIERESVLNERQRIARELHDTLEQGLAGMALQLQSCGKQLESNLERGKEALILAQGMLRHCRDESRNSILDLRGGLLEKMDLPAALSEALQSLADECGAELEVTVHGEPRRLKQFAERHLLRIAKEAATNAARHASPKHIRVELEYRPDALTLTVSDDGGGFTVDQLPKSERFGLHGLRERANRLQGIIEVGSVAGQGTTITVDLPSTDEWELEQP